MLPESVPAVSVPSNKIFPTSIKSPSNTIVSPTSTNSSNVLLVSSTLSINCTPSPSRISISPLASSTISPPALVLPVALTVSSVPSKRSFSVVEPIDFIKPELSKAKISKLSENVCSWKSTSVPDSTRI